MWAYRLIAPSAHFYFEGALDRFAQVRGSLSRCVVVVDVRVIATYDRGIDRIGRRDDSIVADYFRSRTITGI